MRNLAKLRFPDPNLDLHLTTDASDTAVGAVIEQEVGGKRYPLAFFSEKLNPAQRNHGAFDRELLAVKLAVQKYHHWFEAKPAVV